MARWSQIKTCFNAYCLVSVVRQLITRVIAVCFIFKNFVNLMTYYKFEEFFRFRWYSWVWKNGTELKTHGVIACRRGQYLRNFFTDLFYSLRVKSYCATSLWILAECNIAVNIYMPTFLYARRGAQLKPVISWDLFSDAVGFQKSFL